MTGEAVKIKGRWYYFVENVGYFGPYSSEDSAKSTGYREHMRARSPIKDPNS